MIDDQALFDAFIQLIANAIDLEILLPEVPAKRVPILPTCWRRRPVMLRSQPLKDFSMTEDERYCLNVAGWLHDCGKIITPEYMVGKATKLEVISDRIK